MQADRDQVDELLRHPISELFRPGSRRKLVTAAPETPLDRAYKLLWRRRVGCVLIVDANGKLAGIFSERDALRCAAAGTSADTPLSRVMTRKVECLSAGDPVVYAMNRMIDGGYRHVPLLAEDGSPSGMVSVRDVVRHSGAENAILAPELGLPIAELLRCLGIGSRMAFAPGQSVAGALACMLANSSGCVVIVDTSGKPQGVFSERDLIKLLARGVPLTESVAGHMTVAPLTLPRTAALREAVALMNLHGFRHIPCIDGSGKFSDLLSMRDIVAYWRELHPEAVLCLPPHPKHERSPHRDGA